MTRTVTVMTAREARAQLDATNDTDAQLTTFAEELQRALQRKRPYVYMDYPMTTDTHAHLDAQGYRTQLIDRQHRPRHYKIHVP